MVPYLDMTWTEKPWLMCQNFVDYGKCSQFSWDVIKSLKPSFVSLMFQKLNLIQLNLKTYSW